MALKAIGTLSWRSEIPRNPVDSSMGGRRAEFHEEINQVPAETGDWRHATTKQFNCPLSFVIHQRRSAVLVECWRSRAQYSQELKFNLIHVITS